MREEEERQQGINFAKNNILKFYIYKRSLNDKLHYRINLKKNIHGILLLTTKVHL